jgi:hypothetical protein
MLSFCGGEVHLESEGRKVLSGKWIVSVLLILLLVLSIFCSLPVSSETPVCEITGDDLAPKFIFTGDPHISDLNDIPMLKIIFNTSSETEITVDSIILHRLGRASDSDVAAVEIFEDANNNSEYDFEIDEKISSSTFELGKSEHDIGRTINNSAGLTIFVVLDIFGNASSNVTMGLNIPDESFIECQGAQIELDLPIHSKNSTIYLDTDGDFNPDIYDPDDDNDGYMDAIELISGSDPKNQFSIPKDNDSDYVPDSIDTDDDNDGVLDKNDDFPFDETRQKDYTVVILYAIIAVLLIIIMLVVLNRGKPKIPKSALEIEDEKEFKMSKKGSDFDEKIFEDDHDLIDDL